MDSGPTSKASPPSSDDPSPRLASFRRVLRRLNPATWPPIAWLGRTIRDSGSFRRPLFWWVAGAVFFVGANGLAYALIDNWKTEVEDLQGLATIQGDAIGHEDATIKGQEERIALLTDQANATDARLSDLGSEAQAEKVLSDAFKSAAVGFEKCADDRGTAVINAWSGRSVASLTSTAKTECAEAQKSLDAAKKAD